MVEHKVEQRSDEWFNLKMGYISPSRYPKLMKSPKQRTEWNETQLDILRDIAAERITQEREESYTSKAMQWGNDHEESALHLFQVQQFEEVRTTGFIKLNEWVGGSPDGIIVRDGEDWGIAEVKCKMSKNHLLYLLDADELKKAHGWQAIGYCHILGVRNYSLISYDPRFPDDRQIVIYSGVVTDEELVTLENRLNDAIEKIKEWI